MEGLDATITAINEPKRIACGAPDYLVTRGELPLGYIEAKDIGIDLDAVENSDQLQRYRASLANYQAELLKKWQQDIARQKEQIKILKSVFKEKNYEQ